MSSLNPKERELALRKFSLQLTSYGMQFAAAKNEFTALCTAHCISGCSEGQDAARNKLHALLDLMLDSEATLTALNNEE